MAEDTCKLHGVYLCPECFDMTPIDEGEVQIVVDDTPDEIPPGTFYKLSYSVGPYAYDRRALYVSWQELRESLESLAKYEVVDITTISEFEFNQATRPTD